MPAPEFKTASLLAAAALTTPAQAAESVAQLVSAIKHGDDKARGEAWQNAAPVGALAMQPLAALLADTNFEVARSAKRAMYRILRHAGRPGAAAEARAVEQELIPLLQSPSAPVRKEAAWMLSEIGGPKSIAPMAELLQDPQVCEDARCALMRFPDSLATAALRHAFARASEDFKPALAESLRVRGETVQGYPSQKLTPTRRTTVGQSQAK